MDVLLFIVGVVVGILVVAVFRAGTRDTDDWEPQSRHTPAPWREGGTVADDWQPPPPKRHTPDLFTLVVGIALGAALFGDDDE